MGEEEEGGGARYRGERRGGGEWERGGAVTSMCGSASLTEWIHSDSAGREQSEAALRSAVC